MALQVAQISVFHNPATMASLEQDLKEQLCPKLFNFTHDRQIVDIVSCHPNYMPYFR